MPRVKLFRYGIQIGQRSFELTREGSMLSLAISRPVSVAEACEKHGLEIPPLGTVDDHRYLRDVLQYLRAAKGRTATLAEDRPWTVPATAARTPVTFDSIWQLLRTMCKDSSRLTQSNGALGQVVILATPAGQGEPIEHYVKVAFTSSPPRRLSIKLVE